MRDDVEALMQVRAKLERVRFELVLLGRLKSAKKISEIDDTLESDIVWLIMNQVYPDPGAK